jgi:hypothetical protein
LSWNEVGLAFLRVKNIEINIKNTLRIILISVLFYLKFGSEMRRVLASLRVKGIKIEIKNTWCIYLNSALYSLKR